MSGPCLCGDTACGSCNPGGRAAEAMAEYIADRVTERLVGIRLPHAGDVSLVEYLAGVDAQDVPADGGEAPVADAAELLVAALVELVTELANKMVNELAAEAAQAAGEIAAQIALEEQLASLDDGALAHGISEMMAEFRASASLDFLRNPITTEAEARAYIAALVASGHSYHLDDDAAEILRFDTTPMFTSEEAELANLRAAECAALVDCCAVLESLLAKGDQ